MSEQALDLVSSIVRITVFEDRAEVLRRVIVPAGAASVRVVDLSPCLDERSVEVLPEGDDDGAESAAPAHRVLFHRHPSTTGSVDDHTRTVETLEAVHRQAEKDRDEANERETRASEERARLTSLLTTVIDGARRSGGRRSDTAEAYAITLTELEQGIAEAIEREAAANADAVIASQEAARAYHRLEEARTAEPALSARIALDFGRPLSRERTFTLRYRVASVLWRPEHLARLVGATSGVAGAASVEIVTYATAWQTTGERWDDVTVRFSTARPSKPATPPLLTEDVLHAVRYADQRVIVEARDQTIAVAGSSEGGIRESSEMLGVDDGGEPLSFEPSERISFPSTGRPLRVEIERRTMPATATRIVYPERSPVAHVRASVTLSGDTPLLAGPLRIARNESIVGRSRIDFSALGEPLDLGFGPDDSIRAKREIKEERDTTTLTGTQRIRRTVRVFVSNVSGLARSFDVVERIPVSEIGDVEVLAETNDWSFDGKDGFARRRIDLQPGAIASLLLSYEIRAASRVVLPF